jgi:hypothetical protein
LVTEAVGFLETLFFRIDIVFGKSFSRSIRSDAVTEFDFQPLLDIGLDFVPVTFIISDSLKTELFLKFSSV